MIQRNGCLWIEFIESLMDDRCSLLFVHPYLFILVNFFSGQPDSRQSDYCGSDIK